MKKQITFLLIGFGVLAFSTLSFAETTFSKQAGARVMTVTGTIDSVNAARNVLIVKDNNVPHYYTVQVPSDYQIASLQAGQNVTAVSYNQGPLVLK